MQIVKEKFRPVVYLAGPIGGLTWEEAHGWRERAPKLIAPCKTLSPMRDMDGQSLRSSCFTKDGREQAIEIDQIPFHKLFQRDYMDVHTCDAMLINMIGAKTKSTGTICEIAWAYRRGTPMFMAMEPEGNPNDNPFITPQVPRRYPTLADAINGLREFYGYEIYEAGSAD